MIFIIKHLTKNIHLNYNYFFIMKIILFFLIFQEYIPISKSTESNIFYVEKIKTLENANISYPYLLPEDYRISDGDTLEIRFFGHLMEF